MLKIIFSLVCFLFSLSVASSSTSIACDYEIYNYYKLGESYHCNVATALHITNQESAQIGAISGTHAISKTDNDVVGFYLVGNTVEFFPRGLEKFFKNIQAIYLGSCKIKEIYQEDLKPFPKLAYLYIATSDIEVLEEDLFAYNPELLILGVEGSKVTHIDPNIFDHLTKLEYFWFQQVPCAKVKYIYGSRAEVQKAIKSVKTLCINSEYLELDTKIMGLESDAKSLSSENFKEKLENFEKTFKNSKFAKFRPLKGKFEALKSQKIDNSIITSTTASTTISSVPKPKLDLENCSNKPNSLSALINELKNITIDLKTSQCGLKADFTELKDQIKMSQSSTTTSLSDITSKINDIKSSNSQNFDTQKVALNDVKLTQLDLKNVCSASQSTIIDSLSNLTKNLKLSQDDVKILQYEIKGSVSDMESSLSGLKTYQNDVKVALIKLKTTQNEMKISIDELKVDKSENSEGGSSDCGGKSGNSENLEGQLADLAGKFDENRKEMTNKFHKMSTNFDEKIKGIEKRLMKKFEEVLEEKLGKFLSDKLGSI